MPRILTLCPEEFPGVTAVLRNGKDLGLWEFKYLDAWTTLQDEYDLVILGAWHPEYEKVREKFKRVACYLTSTIGQMELSNDAVELMILTYVTKMLKDKRLVAVLAGSEDVKHVLNDDRAFYSPYPFDYKPLAERAIHQKLPNSVGLFAPTAQRKNLMVQLYAAGFASKDVHTNIQFGLPPEITKYGWLNQDHYYSVLQRMTVTLHCGFTESYCYAAAESIMLGTVPIVTLQIARSLGLAFDGSLPNVVFVPDSIADIAEHIRMILSLKEAEYWKLIENLQDLVAQRAEENLINLKANLDKIVNVV